KFLVSATKIYATVFRLRQNSPLNIFGRWPRAQLGAWVCLARNVAHFATLPVTLKMSLTSRPSPLGQQNSLIHNSAGKMLNGSRNNGAASLSSKVFLTLRTPRWLPNQG